MKLIQSLFIGCGLLFVLSCSKNPTDDSINLFSVEKDIELGAQLDADIRSNPNEYPILSESAYPEAYAHLRRITDNILNSGQVFYKDRFEWKIAIIEDDEVLNAFAAPGGFIYVYTGIIKYLDSEYQLAGVMGHEIAHADRRHSTDQLTKRYGVSILLQAALGQESALAQISEGLLALSFSRKDESEADEYSVIYLCPTEYQADGAASFFEKITSGGGSQPPVFLSTHPDPENRVAEIRNKANELACPGTGTFDQRYQDFKNSLP
jgi:predicted Zn-dependent protease